jgi:hypothetical protein
MSETLAELNWKQCAAAHSSGNMLVMGDGSKWGPFTSHWAATAALIRLGDPTFKSLGGDKAVDLAIERDIRAALSSEGK